MSLSDKLAELAPNTQRYKNQPGVFPTNHPKGWEPGVAFDGSKFSGVAIQALEGSPVDPDHARLLTEWGFDPEKHHIQEGSLQFRTWDACIGNGEVQKMVYYKANIVAGKVLGTQDIEELRDYVRSLAVDKQPPPKTPLGVEDDAFVVVINDIQIGNSEGGGSGATLERLMNYLDGVVNRVKELRTIGRPLKYCYILFGGDLVEGCDGFYAQQSFTVDLDRRGQLRLVREIIVKFIKTLAELFERVVCAAVAGNHGENRKDGKSYTTDADNDDVAVVECVAEVLAENPAFNHVSFIIPDDEMSLALDIAGVNVGLAHGHTMGKGNNAPMSGKKWWEGQVLGLQPVFASQLLITGHYHFFFEANYGLRTHIQAPAADGGSQWYTNSTGMSSPPGMLTLRVSKENPLGYTDLAVIR